MIEELNKSIASISSDIKGLQTQAAGLDKAVSKLAGNQATLLSMSAEKPQAPPIIGMKSIVITENTPRTLEETLEELKNYPKFLLPFVSQLVCLGEEANEIEDDETIMIMDERKVEVKMLSEVKDPLLDLEKCSLHEHISILQKFASDTSVNFNQAGFDSYIANHVLKEKIARYNRDAMIPPKLGDAWIPKVLVTIGKETHHAILDLRSSVSILSKELYELLELRHIEK
jgi:prefoldin subunit 5